MRDRLKKSEFWSAMILLVLHVAVFPIALSLLSQAKGYSLSAAQTNLLYYSVSLLLYRAAARGSASGQIPAPQL